MHKSRLGRLAAVFGLGIMGTACDDGTAPDLLTELDTETVLADYQAVDSVLASPGFAAFRALGHRTPFSASPAAVDAVGGLAAAGRMDGGRTFALELFRRLRRTEIGKGAAAAPIISRWTRGGTFVYDPATDRYALDPGRTGAPDTGVRFILYAVDGSGIPIVEQETGYADLVDEGDGSVEDVVLHLTVVDRDVTVLDYRTTLDGEEGRGALTVRGFLVGGGVRLDFDIDAAGTSAAGRQTLDVSFELRVDQRDFGITGSVRGIEDGVEGEGDIEVRVHHRTHSMGLDVHGADGTIDGSVYLDGNLFATVSGPADNPDFRGASGEPLTVREVLVLRHVVDSVEDVFDLLEDLLDPVDELVILGILL